MNIDDALQALERFIAENPDLTRNAYNEADTRVKYIDPLLTHVLGWDEHQHIRREQRYSKNDDKKCIDYLVSLAEPILVVEAKRTDSQFEIPTTLNQIHYKLNGVLRDWPHVWSAVTQAREYADDKGARYALVANGHQFIAFKAIVERGPWHEGVALVINSLDTLKKHFTPFFECLSRSSIAKDKLSEIALGAHTPRFRDRPRNHVHFPFTGHRNQLYDVLHQTFAPVLLDIVEPTPEFLKECYCTNEDLLKYGQHLNGILIDPIPVFKSPVHPVKAGHRKDPFAKAMEGVIKRTTRDPLIVVMGGAGVGKSTFLRWYFDTALPTPVRDKCFLVWVDYRTIECSLHELHDVTVRLATERLLSASFTLTGSLDQKQEIFHEEAKHALAGNLRWASDDPRQREQALGELFGQLERQDPEHLKRVTQYLVGKCGRQVIVVLDNMDQKDEDLQFKLFQIAQELVHRCGLVVLISMRESSYYAMLRSPKANAFSQLDFHVRAQPLAAILSKRLAFLEASLNAEPVKITSASGQELDIADFHRFLQLIGRSLVGESADQRIVECIESVTNADIREQLGLLYSFLISGQTKVDEYFWGYTTAATTIIPFHEVLHSLIMEDRRVFSEPLSKRFMNVFEPGPAATSSHFTALRVLSYFKSLGQTGELLADDYIDLAVVSTRFAPQGLSHDDMCFHYRRLAEYGLLMPRSQAALGAFLKEPFAITRSGLYYLNRLYFDTVYATAAAMDTSVFDETTCANSASILKQQATGPKFSVTARLALARLFVEYLGKKEAAELASGAAGRDILFGTLRFVPSMEADLSAVEDNLARSRRSSPGTPRSNNTRRPSG